MIRAVLFDAAGTLIHLPRGVGWHYRTIAARHGMTLTEESLGQAFAKAFKDAERRAATEGPRPDDDKGWWKRLVRRVLAGCGQEPADEEFDAMFEELYAHFGRPGVWSLYPEAMQVLEDLHGRYRMAIVSNFDRRLYPVLEELGVSRFFETMVISSELGIDKPAPRMFITAMDRLGVLASETVHVGDDPEQDWRAAEAAGLHTYKVDRPARGLEGLHAYLRDIW